MSRIGRDKGSLPVVLKVIGDVNLNFVAPVCFNGRPRKLPIDEHGRLRDAIRTVKVGDVGDAQVILVEKPVRTPCVEDKN